MNLEDNTKKLDRKIDNTKKLIDDFIQKNSDLSSLGEYKSIIEKTISEIKIIKEELEKESYMLLVIGGVKSGKSSLINALIGKESAITKTGVETTMYPSIISYYNKNEIIVYEKSAESKPNAKETNYEASLVGDVINDIKGLSSAKETLYEKGIKKQQIDLSNKNLDKYVATSERNPNILLINIRIEAKENSIINNNTFIIDTPGIDGIKAGYGGVRDEEDKNKIGEELIKRSEYIIFMQSSLTPLSRENIRLLETNSDISNRSIFFVHNKFSINPWRKEEESNAEQTKSSIKTFKDFDIDINPQTVDLGKANDSIFKIELKGELTPNQLLEESKLKELEKDIKTSISKNGKRTHLQTQISNLNNKLEKIEKEISEKYQDFKTNMTNKRNKILDDFNKILENLNKFTDEREEKFIKILINPQNKYILNLKDEIIFNLDYNDFNKNEKIENEKNKENKKIENEINKEKLENRKILLGKEIIKKHNQNVDVCIDIENFNKFINKIKDNESIRNLIDSINKEIDDKNPYSEFKLNKSDLAELKFDESDLDKINFIDPQQLKNLRFFNRDAYFLEHVKQMEKEAVDSFYKNNNIEDAFYNILYKKVKAYEDNIQKAKNDFDGKNLDSKEEDEYKKAKEFLKNLRTLRESIENDE